MRLIFGAVSSDPNADLSDLWIKFSSGGSFVISTYLARGYDRVDAYVVGAGGGGGGGGRGYSSTSSGGHYFGGGGGGGGGGGALRIQKGAKLLNMSAIEKVVVASGGNGGALSVPGSYGGYSAFNGCIARGGGHGGGAGNASSSAYGYGGGGGGGGGRNSAGVSGAEASKKGAAGGKAVCGGGTGGTGAGYGKTGLHGTTGKRCNLDGLDFGGGGGGGGGKGTGDAGEISYAEGGVGGPGDRSVGGDWLGAISGATPGSGRVYVGRGGGGGGGVNLTKIVGYARLTGAGNSISPGGGGQGGHGGLGPLFPGGGATVGSDGADGCVLLRVYVG